MTPICRIEQAGSPLVYFPVNRQTKPCQGTLNCSVVVTTSCLPCAFAPNAAQPQSLCPGFVPKMSAATPEGPCEGDL